MIKFKSGKVFTLAELKENTDQFLTNPVKTRDIKACVQQYFSEDFRLSVTKAANQSTFIFDINLTFEDLLHLAQPKEILKESAKIIQNSFQDVSYDLNDKFCDAILPI